MFKLRKIVLLIGLLFGQLSSASDEAILMDLDDVKQSMAFNVLGHATFSLLWWDIYDSTLMTTSGRFPIDNATDSLIFEILYLTDIAANDLIDKTIEQWEVVGIAPERYTRYLPELRALWPNIKDGDKLSLLLSKAESHFYFNQKYLGQIAGEEFGSIFLQIWLSEKTSQPELKSKLLGESHEK